MPAPPSGGHPIPADAPTERFSDRVANYTLYRPTYPEEVLDILREETRLTSAATVADVGSGTGLSAELFLRNGNPVFGVEPNAAMRAEAERLLCGYANFHSVSGRAEATGLPHDSVDYVVAAQAFHWFDRGLARQEFARILRTDGWIVLLWNDRRLDSTPFLRGYEALLQRFGTDYMKVRHNNIDPESLKSFFSRQGYLRRSVANRQRLDFAGLRGRLLSSSYVPTEAHPRFGAMIVALRALFDEHADRGEVTIDYDTRIFLGHVE